MSYDHSNISMMTYGNDFTLWSYITPDHDVCVDGYFNAAFDMLSTGDVIFVTTRADSPQIFTSQVCVLSVEDGHVVVGTEPLPSAQSLEGAAA